MVQVYLETIQRKNQNFEEQKNYKKKSKNQQKSEKGALLLSRFFA